jgi:uncharacterized protein (DUF885 family)
MPFDSVKHYEDYIARLHQIPEAFLQTEEVLRAGVNDHLVPVRFIAEKIPGRPKASSPPTPSFLPLKKFPASFSDADKKRLTDEITTTVNNEVFPAYKQFAAFITTDYIPHARTTLSINSLGGGKRRYQATLRRFTTTDLTAAQIHEIGLKRSTASPERWPRSPRPTATRTSPASATTSKTTPSTGRLRRRHRRRLPQVHRPDAAASA